MGATVWRETPSYAVYFASFEYIGQVIGFRTFLMGLALAPCYSPKLFSCGGLRYVGSKQERGSLFHP
jgi:hypothetical protein